jgi:hypothetical protein
MMPTRVGMRLMTTMAMMMNSKLSCTKGMPPKK